MSYLLTIIALTLLSLLIRPSCPSPLSSLGSFCAHIKEVPDSDPEIELWLPCDDVCTSIDIADFHYVDVSDASSCTFYDDPGCKLDPSHTGEVIKGPQKDWELKGGRTAYKCGRVVVEGRRVRDRAVAEDVKEARYSPLCVAVGYLKEYTSSSLKDSRTLIGDSACNKIIEVRDYQYISLFADSRCDLYTDTACNDQMGDDFTGPLQDVRFESGDTLKSYQCEALKNSQGI